MISGSLLVFGVVLLPLYLVLAGWFFGEPRHPKHAATGVFFLAGIAVATIVALWLLGAVLSVVV